MADERAPTPINRDWIQPPQESEGLSRYIETLRERIWLVVGVTALTTLLAILYVASATKLYEAESQLFVTPVAPGEPTLQALPLITKSSDPTRDVTTAAQLVTTVEVAQRVIDDLGLEDDPEALLGDITAEPVAQTDIIVVTATSDDPQEAADLADAFARQAVKNRTDLLHDQIDQILPELSDQLESDPSNALNARIVALRQLRSAPDPTLRVEAEATVPTAAVSPRPLLSIAGGLLAGLVLGAAAAFTAQGLDPRLRREEQLRRLYRLPILARIPREGRGTPDRPLGPESLSPVATEAFRTLRGTVSMIGGRTGSRSILVTGSSPSEGKTTTGINLAAALAATGKKVILIEADLRRPAVGRALGMSAPRGVVSVLIESVAIEDALVESEQFGPNLQLLLADYEGGWISELFALPAALQMIDEAKLIADYVIIDSPPLTDVIDTLPLARHVDDVLIVVRPRTTRLNKLSRLGELLVENGIRPMGFAVVGTAQPGRSEKSYYAEQRESMLHPHPNPDPRAERRRPDREDDEGEAEHGETEDGPAGRDEHAPPRKPADRT